MWWGKRRVGGSRRRPAVRTERVSLQWGQLGQRHRRLSTALCCGQPRCPHGVRYGLCLITVGLLLTHLGGKQGWRHALAAAVWSDLVIVLPPLSCVVARLFERHEHMLVQTLIAQRVVQTLDVAVLHGSARLDEDMLDLVFLAPG